MTLATVESIARLGKIDPADIMQNFLMWFADAAFTPWDSVFDIGGATRRAITRYASGMNLSDCGGKSRMDNGNGSLMRILPLAFIPCSVNDVNTVSGLTHNHEISKRACRLYLIIAEQILKGNPFRAYYTDTDIWGGEFSRVREIWKLTRDEIKSSGYVVDTLEAALWCLYHTNTYRDCVLTAVNLGEDTDTVAAVAGGLAGILYGCGGESGIPDEWISQIARKDWIKGLCDKFENKLSR
jgi:ADP-ribosylglycohydrolase